MTGLLQSIQIGIGGGTGVQNLGYEWDLVGNLKKRKDLNQSNLTEEFFYDRLYRLDYSTLNGVQNLDLHYDLLGNLIGKSDVGTYTYHATKKHQVVSISNGWSFGYDANGNMTSGRGAAMEWTSYNYPACIRTAGACTGTTSDWSQFSYTPDRQYWKQVSNYLAGGSATTIYVDGLLEKVTTSGGTDFRHMIRAGNTTIIVSRTAGGVDTVKYVTTDHLASSAAITNSSGGILVNESFDAFGKRRGANWAGSPSGADWSAIAASTRRGYTEHSMLDNLGLTHMNGRVYDPVLGRFLSADPNIYQPTSTQSFNRYSYVQNNPLRFVDPSGFQTITCTSGGQCTNEFGESVDPSSHLVAGDEVRLEGGPWAWESYGHGEGLDAVYAHPDGPFNFTFTDSESSTPIKGGWDSDAGTGRRSGGSNGASSGNSTQSHSESAVADATHQAIANISGGFPAGLIGSQYLDSAAEVAGSVVKWVQIGRQGEEAVKSFLLENGYEILAEHLFVRTEIGLRITDFVVTGGHLGDTVGGVEVKANSATRSIRQIDKDLVIRDLGGVVRSIGNPFFPQGSHIQYDTGVIQVEIEGR